MSTWQALIPLSNSLSNPKTITARAPLDIIGVLVLVFIPRHVLNLVTKRSAIEKRHLTQYLMMMEEFRHWCDTSILAAFTADVQSNVKRVHTLLSQGLRQVSSMCSRYSIRKGRQGCDF